MSILGNIIQLPSNMF